MDQRSVCCGAQAIPNYTAGGYICINCRQTCFIALPIKKDSWDNLISDKQKLGYLGAIILVFGTFLPIANVPLFGPIAYIAGDGIFVAGLGVLSVILVHRGEYKNLNWTAGLSLFIIAQLFAGIRDIQLVSIGYGMFVMLAGTAALFYSAYLDRHDIVPQTPAKPNAPQYGTCPRCETNIDLSQPFCASCGLHLAAKPVFKPSQKDPHHES